MENMLEILRSDTFLVIIGVFAIVLFIGMIIILIRTANLNKRYQQFMKKLGNGRNIEEDLENYMYRVEKVERQNADILSFCKGLE